MANGTTAALGTRVGWSSTFSRVCCDVSARRVISCSSPSARFVPERVWAAEVQAVFAGLGLELDQERIEGEAQQYMDAAERSGGGSVLSRKAETGGV